MAFNLSTIRNGLYTFVSTVTNQTTIWYRPNAPRPPLPYITIDIKDYEMVNRDWIAPLDEDCNSYLAGNREFNLDVNAYGPNALVVLERLQTMARTYDIQNLLLDYGLIYVNRVAIVNVSELLDTKWEQRYKLEMRFRVSNQGIDAPEKFQVGSIETVTGTGTIKKEDGTIGIQVDYEISKNTD
jgi:hypothetical protein